MKEKFLKASVKIQTEVNYCLKDKRVMSPRYVAFLSVLSVFICSTSLVFAGGLDDFKTKVIDMLGEVYGVFIAISIALGAVVIVLALMIRGFSNHQRTIEGATMWAKRIIITIVLINVLGLGYGIITDLTEGNSLQWTTVSS